MGGWYFRRGAALVLPPGECPYTDLSTYPKKCKREESDNAFLAFKVPRSQYYRKPVGNNGQEGLCAWKAL